MCLVCTTKYYLLPSKWKKELQSFEGLAIGMFVTILAKKCVLACVCYSLAKCCCKINEDDEVRRRRCRKVLYEGF